MSEYQDLTDRPTIDQATAYQNMFDYFNKALFDGKLPHVMLVMSRNSNLLGGYYSPNRWTDEDHSMIGEIAMNVNVMKNEGAVKAMSILIHEMLHMWQQEFGKPSRPGYHNAEWVAKAKQVGLQPYGRKGEETGQCIDTKIIPGGKAEKAIEDFPEEYILPWLSEPMEDPSAAPPQGGGESGGGTPGGGTPGGGGTPVPVPKKPGTRNKYTCPTCGWNIWGKPGASILCMPCGMQFIEMRGGQDSE